MNTLHPALLSLFRLTGQLAERASSFATRAGLDDPIHHLLHVRREKLHRAAVLGLLLLTLLAGSDSEAATRERDASVVQAALSSPDREPASVPPHVQPGVTGTTISTGAASADAMLAWLKRQPGFPSGQGVQTRLDILRQPRIAHLAPCQHTEYVLAAGARLWGRVNLGERCTSGATWTVWHNLQVHVEGPALVARQQLAAGSVPQPANFSVQRVDWTRSPTPPLPIDTRLGGQELQRTLAAGQSLHADHLRPAPSIRSGEVVAAIAEGDGFRIATDAIALASAGEGQSIRVRTPGGKVLSGLVEGKTVKIFR